MDDVHCHTCGTTDAKLTFEHAPTLRVQKLLAISRYRLTNPIGLINEKNRDRPLPPARRYPRGLGRETLCNRCQQLTQSQYGQAFYDWSVQALRVAEKVNPDEDSVLFDFEIQPLRVIKQMVTSLLAIGDFLPTLEGVNLRKFLQQPARSEGIAPFALFIYLNPPDPKYGLPQSRLSRTQFHLDTKGGPCVHCHAELAYPPMGYVMIWHESYSGLAREVRQLTEITHFSTYGPGEILKGRMNLAVRTPFGPASLRYWQTARRESQEAA